MSKSIIIFFTIIIFTNAQSQHLYPEKFDGCITSRFCLDCGDPQAEIPQTLAQDLIANLHESALKDLKGTIEVQILIDENGKPCLLSADNKTKISSKKLKLQKAINGILNWKPAVSGNKKTKSSISLLLQFNNGNVQFKRKIFDFKNQTNMSSKGTPDVKGTDNDKLSKTWILYNQQTSELPWDMTRAITVDQDNIIWIGTDNGITAVIKDKWNHYNSKNTIISAPAYNKNETQSVRYAEIDKKNNKWFIIGWDAYKFDNEKWTKYDSLNSPINWARKIFVDHSNNIWFTSWDGVAKFNGIDWITYTKSNAQLPTDKTLGVFVDKSNKVWIGTFEGNVIIENGKTRLINEKDSPLSKGYISQMYEDRKGKLWFSLYNDKSAKDEGIYVLETSGKWTKLEFPNRMLVNNSINDFLLDEDKNELWVTVNGVGVLLYDFSTKKWEVYTNKNSLVPSVNAEQITKDKNGSIWIATYAGVIKTE